jgi:ribonuclease E
MPKIMLINVTHSEESRVGIVDDRVLQAFEIESLSREHLKGNIYKGIVHRIHPALEAAFVDIGAERDAFLPLDEICFRNMRASETPQQPAGENGRRRRRIRDILRPSEEIIVQIAKEQFANKPPTLTTFYSLPGRYLVLLPGSDDTGISRRIEGEERTRLRKVVDDLNPPEGFGVIVRTAAGVDEDAAELSRDFAYLQRLWDNVQQVAATKRAPALVYREHDIVLRTIRDFLTPDIDEIHIDNEEVYQRARTFLADVMPGKEHLLRLYRGEQPIFSAFDVESQIESIFKRRVQLKSGASIVIDGTEALTAIDVNSGGSVRGQNPEETAFRTNVEAATQIARQLRLRDIGGLIVIDFIDMRESEHIHEVERTLREAMRVDRARHETGRISRFGLMEVSRQRLRPAATTTTYAACPMCEGHGAIRTTESAALVALRKIHNRVVIGDIEGLRVSLPKLVALYLLNQKRDDLAQLEERYSCNIQVELSDKLMPHEVEIETRERTIIEKPVLAEHGTVAEPDASAAADAPANEEAAPTDGGAKKKRRRRGRRRGSGRRAATAVGEALATLGKLVGYFRGEEGEEQGEPGTAPSAPTETGGEATRQEAEPAAPTAEAAAPPSSEPGVAPSGTDQPASTGEAGEARRPGTGRRRRRRRGGSKQRQTAQAATSGTPDSPSTGSPTVPSSRSVETPPASASTPSERSQPISEPTPLERSQTSDPTSATPSHVSAPSTERPEAKTTADRPPQKAKPERTRRTTSRRGSTRSRQGETKQEDTAKKVVVAKKVATKRAGDDAAKPAKAANPRRKPTAKAKTVAAGDAGSAAKPKRARAATTRKRKPATAKKPATDS